MIALLFCIVLMRMGDSYFFFKVIIFFSSSESIFQDWKNNKTQKNFYESLISLMICFWAAIIFNHISSFYCIFQLVFRRLVLSELFWEGTRPTIISISLVRLATCTTLSTFLHSLYCQNSLMIDLWGLNANFNLISFQWKRYFPMWILMIFYA